MILNPAEYTGTNLSFATMKGIQARSWPVLLMDIWRFNVHKGVAVAHGTIDKHFDIR